MLLQLRPAGESVRSGRDQLCVSQRETREDLVRVRVKLVHARERVSVSGLQGPAEPLGVLAKVFDGWVIGKRTCRHCDLLARIQAGWGLRSAASGEEAACLV